MEIINFSLNTHFYYNISIDLDPSHSSINSNFFLYTVKYTALEISANVQTCRIRLFAAYFDINASRFIKFFLISCYMRYKHTPTPNFIKLHTLF